MHSLRMAAIAVGLAFTAGCGNSSSSSTPNPSGGAGSAATPSGGSSGTATGGGSTGVSAGGSTASASGGAGAAPGNTGGQSASTGGANGDGGASAGGASAGGAAAGTGGNTIGGSAAGGSATGGTDAAGAGGGAGGQPSPATAELVTSGPNDYWNTQATVAIASGAAELTVDASAQFQTLSGFGGTFNEMGWDALSVLDAAEVTRAMKLLFHASEGANFVYGRLPLGASDYSMSWYTLAETAGDYAMNDFSIARDREKLIPFIRAALEVKPDIKLWASPWVVPSWMMSGRDLKNDPETMGAHALYMARFVEEYAKEGLELVAVHPQNEPGYARVRWTQAQFVDYIKTYLGPTFAERGITAEIWAGTMSKDPEDTNIAKAVAADPEAMKYTKGFGVQWNLQAAVATLAESAPVMQTEHKCGNYNFETPYWDRSRYDPEKPQNDHLYGEETWQLLRDWIVSGVNSYSAWNMVLDSVGKSLDNWPQNALLVVDRSAKQLIVTPAYYAFRHYSQFVLPGAKRVAVTGSKDAIAFVNPDGSVVTEVYNSGDTAKSTSVGIGGVSFGFDVPAHGWATLRVSQGI